MNKKLNKSKTRNTNFNNLLVKKTYNLSFKKYDICGSTNISNKSNYIHSYKNLSIKSKNKNFSRPKGRPNSIFSQNKKNNCKNNYKLINKYKIKNFLSKEKKNIKIFSNIKMLDYNLTNSNIIVTQNLTEREQHYTKIKNNIKDKTPKEKNKTIRKRNIPSGIYINLSNLDNINSKEVNTERTDKRKYIKFNIKFNKNLSNNKSHNGISGIFLNNNNTTYKDKSKNKLSSSRSVSKSKSRSKSNYKKRISYKKLKIRTKSNLTKSLKSTMDEISKWKKINLGQKYIHDQKSKVKKFCKVNEIERKRLSIMNNNNFNKTNYGNVNYKINNDHYASGGVTSRTRNLKTYNIYLNTNNMDIDKSKNNDANSNKENISLNRKKSNNIFNNNNNLKNNNSIKKINNNLIFKKCSFNNGNNIVKDSNKTCRLKQLSKKSMSKNYTEKILIENNLFLLNGFKKFSRGKKNIIKNK